MNIRERFCAKVDRNAPSSSSGALPHQPGSQAHFPGREPTMPITHDETTLSPQASATSRWPGVRICINHDRHQAHGPAQFEGDEGQLLACAATQSELIQKLDKLRPVATGSGLFFERRSAPPSTATRVLWFHAHAALIRALWGHARSALDQLVERPDIADELAPMSQYRDHARRNLLPDVATEGFATILQDRIDTINRIARQRRARPGVGQ